MKNRKTSIVTFEFTSDSAQELLGRQSVRTTFKLSERSIDALSILAGQLGIKQKSLFDHLIDDLSILNLLAEESQEYEIPKQRVPKTFVISRKTLQNLEKVSRRYQTPRDALVELSIERILPLISQEKKKHEHRKKMKESMKDILLKSERLFEDAYAHLEQDDPVCRRAYQMVRSIKACYDEVEESVERGRKIEDF